MIVLRAYIAVSRAIDLGESAQALTAQAELLVARSRTTALRKHWRCDGCDNLLATSLSDHPGFELICPDCGMTWHSGTAAHA